MTTNSTAKKILKVLWNQGKSNNNSLLTENVKKLNTFALKKQAENLATILPNITVQSTEFVTLEIFEVDGETNKLYKEWEMFITDMSTVDAEILTGLILPYIDFSIIYSEAQLNDIDFYNYELDLQETSFYETKDNALILHISTYISRYFGSAELVVPQAKVIMNLKNPFEVAN